MEMASFLIDSLKGVIQWLDQHGAPSQGGQEGGGGDFHAIC